jgi:aldose 1-epimerase
MDSRAAVEEKVLRNDRFELTFVPGFGCHWTRLRIAAKGAWLDFLQPVEEPQLLVSRPSGHYGSFVLAPWPNRIAGGVFSFDGKLYELRTNAKDGTAIHGDVRSRPWKVLALDERRFEAELDSRDFDDFNFPFDVLHRQRFELTRESLRVTLSLENVDSRRAPVGFGFHPYLRRRLTARDDDVILVVPAEKCYPAENCLPTGPAVPVSDSTDVRRLKPLGNPGLDHCYTALSEPQIRFLYRGSGCEVRFRFDRVFGHVVVFAPREADGAPRPFVAAEPVTAANNGFNLMAKGYEGTGVKVLEPGEWWGGTWEISVGDL